MLLIISENNDQSTNHVIDWIDYLGFKNWHRVNNTDVFEITNYRINSDGYSYDLKSNSICFNFKEIKSYWHRRGALQITFPVLNFNHANKFLYEYLLLENKKLSQSIIDNLYTEKHGLGNIYHAETNKVVNLNVARLVGLSVPNTLITNKRNELLGFLKSNKNGIITKAIRHGSFSDKLLGVLMKGFTEGIEEKQIIVTIPENFGYSFFQEKLAKKFELRIFYLDGQIYSSAIFSQNDVQTVIDFRHYNRSKPNRVVPFKLPNEIENKIKLLMSKLNMKTGSLDFVYTLENQYVFLEVNPFGQFQQVSLPCNYFLEKHIANYLLRPLL